MRSAPYLAPGVLRASSADIPGPSPGTEHHTSCVLFPETAFLPQPTSHPSLPTPAHQLPEPFYPTHPTTPAFLPQPTSHPSLSTPPHQPHQSLTAVTKLQSVDTIYWAPVECSILYKALGEGKAYHEIKGHIVRYGPSSPKQPCLCLRVAERG